jgi:hypothetical protein
LNSKGFRETFLRNDREGPTKAEMAGKKEAKQKAGHVVKQRRIEKKPEVPQEQRTPRRRLGKERPRAHKEEKRIGT